MYDAKGQEVAVTYYFQKAGTDTWNVYATANKTSVAGTDALPQPVAKLITPELRYVSTSAIASAA